MFIYFTPCAISLDKITWSNKVQFNTLLYCKNIAVSEYKNGLRLNVGRPNKGIPPFNAMKIFKK